MIDRNDNNYAINEDIGAMNIIMIGMIMMIMMILFMRMITIMIMSDSVCDKDNKKTTITMIMKGQSEIAYLPKFASIMLIVMVIVITEIL